MDLNLARLRAALHPDLSATEVDARQMINGMLYEYEGAVIGDFRVAGDKIALITFETKVAILVEPGTKVKVTGRPAVTLTQAQAMQARTELLLEFIGWLAHRFGLVQTNWDSEVGAMQTEGDPLAIRVYRNDMGLTTPELAELVAKTRTAVFEATRREGEAA